MSDRWRILDGTAKRASLVALAVVIIRLPSLWEPRWYSDEGTFSTVAWLHSLGRPLYSGVFDINPPGIYWLYGALLGAGGDQHHLVVQVALLLAALVAVISVFAVATRWFGPNVGVAAALLTAGGLSAPTLDGDLLNIEIGALPFFVAALAMALRSGTWSAIAAGLLAACALLIRPSYGLDCVAILFVFWTVPQTLRRMALAAIGAMIVFGTAFGVLAAGHSLGPYLSEATPVQRAYLLWANGGSLLPLVVRLAVLAAIAALGYRLARSMIWRPLAIWLPASIAAASITPRELSHYAIEAVPPLAIAIAALTVATWRQFEGQPSLVRVVTGTVAVPLALTALFLTAEAVLILPARETAFIQKAPVPPPFLHNFSYGALPGYYARWATWVLGHPLQAQPLSGFPGPFGEEQAEARLLDRLSAGSSVKIQVLGDRAWVYFLSRLPPATPYVAMNSAFRLVPAGSTVVAGAIGQHDARFVALADVAPSDWVGKLEADDYHEIGVAPWPTYSVRGK